MSDEDRGRALRRRHMHERQAVVFGVLLAGLAVVGLGAAAVYTGSVDVGFMKRGFSTAASPSEAVADVGPCPPDGALPVAAADVKINVYNATTRVRLAAATGEALTERGFTVASVQDAPAKYDGVAQISFGPAGVAAAYTLKAHIDGAAMLLTAPQDPADTTVSLSLGSEYTELKALDQVGLDPAVPFVAPAGCVPLDLATAAPAG